MLRLLALLLLAAATAAAQGSARDITFASGELMIPGTLTLPAGPAPQSGWPLVVFVQGSGPSDRDETVGVNKPFKDLAEGLAALSIASLRYDKRTWLMAQHKVPLTPASLKTMTLGIEVVDDAVAALAYGAAEPGIDRRRVFVLGHSLGGTMAPPIARERLRQAPGSVRGIIELAAGVLPVTVILPTQVAFQAGLAGTSRAGQQLSIAGTQASLNGMLDLAADPAAVSPLGLPNRYFREWNAVDTAADLRSLAVPALVLHGQRDVQVSYLDFVLLARSATASGSKAVDLPGLGHMFLPVDVESNGGEFMTVASHVPAVVTDTIADWLPR